MIEADLLHWTVNNFIRLQIILMRVVPLLFLLPVLGSPLIPARVKILFSLMVALILMPIVKVNPADMPVSAVGFVVFSATEVALGATLALFARLVFAAVETAGQMVGIQMGMGMAGVMDPQFGNQVSPVGHLWNIIAILIFLAINGHHAFFTTLAESFSWAAPGKIKMTQATFNGIMDGTAHMFVLAVKIMAPASAALFFSHVAMGIIAKTVPQIPILLIGLPLNIAVGLIFVGLSMTYLLPLLIANFNMLGRVMPQLGMGLGG